MQFDEFRVIVDSEYNFRCRVPGASFDVPYERKPDESAALELALRTLTLFNSWLSDDKALDRDTMSVIGSHLYNLLFPGVVDKAFRSVRKRRRDDNVQTSLRIVLEFEQRLGHLAQLPWEFLYLPETSEEPKGVFLCAESDLILMRFIRCGTVTPSDGTGIVRILIVRSSPKGEDLVSDSVVSYLEELARANPERLEVRTKGRPSAGADDARGPTRADFEQWMQRDDFLPDILHVLAHGEYEYSPDQRRERGKIALVDATTGEADWCNDKDFADFFKFGRLPKLVFLHACMGAKTNSYRGFKGLALSLVQQAIPSVVAMQYPVENAVANAFAKGFYDSLLEQPDVGVAVQRGRASLARDLYELQKKQGREPQNFADRRFGSPVAFVQSYVGFSMVQRNAPAINESQPTAEPMTCPYSCGLQHARDDKFCTRQGRALVSCPSCFWHNRDDVSFCRNCGTALDAKRARGALAGAAAPGVPAAPEPAVPATDQADFAVTGGSATHGGRKGSFPL